VPEGTKSKANIDVARTTAMLAKKPDIILQEMWTPRGPETRKLHSRAMFPAISAGNPGHLRVTRLRPVRQPAGRFRRHRDRAILKPSLTGTSAATMGRARRSRSQASCFGQRIALQGKILVYRRNSCIADQHRLRYGVIADGC
jgi:hypothetical protein